MAVNLSNQLISTALTLIAIVGATVIFILEQRDVAFWFYLTSLSSLLSFILSIYFAGRGISKTSSRGYDGNWTLKKSSNFFDYQAKCLIMGTILVCLLFFQGDSKSSEFEKLQVETLESIKSQNSLVKTLLKQDITEMEQRILLLDDSLESVRTRLTQVDAAIVLLKDPIAPSKKK